MSLPRSSNDPLTASTLDHQARIAELEGEVKLLRQQRRLLYAQLNEPGQRQPMSALFFDAFRWLETLGQTTPGARHGSPARRQEDRARLLLAALLTHYEPVLAKDGEAA